MTAIVILLTTAGVMYVLWNTPRWLWEALFVYLMFLAVIGLIALFI